VTTPPSLREPAHQVSPRAIGFWRLTASIPPVLLGCVLVVLVLLRLPVLTVLLPGAVVVAASATYAAVMPSLRFRIHRWEVTGTAVHTRSGWLGREERIAPLSRVQTVDSHQSALMRAFGLKSIAVTTASAAGPVLIECLDAGVADRVVAELTEITGRTEGDAT